MEVDFEEVREAAQNYRRAVLESARSELPNTATGTLVVMTVLSELAVSGAVAMGVTKESFLTAISNQYDRAVAAHGLGGQRAN